MKLKISITRNYLAKIYDLVFLNVVENAGIKMPSLLVLNIITNSGSRKRSVRREGRKEGG